MIVVVITSACYRNAECGEVCRAKKTDLERELRLMRRELKMKDDLINSFEERLKQIQEQKVNNDAHVSRVS